MKEFFESWNTACDELHIFFDGTPHKSWCRPRTMLSAMTKTEKKHAAHHSREMKIVSLGCGLKRDHAWAAAWGVCNADD